MGKDCYHRRIQSVKKIVSSYELSAFSLNLLTGESSEVNYGACDVLVADTVPQVWSIHGEGSGWVGRTIEWLIDWKKVSSACERKLGV